MCFEGGKAPALGMEVRRTGRDGSNTWDVFRWRFAVVAMARCYVRPTFMLCFGS